MSGFDAMPWMFAGGLMAQVHSGFEGPSKALAVAQRAHD